MGSGRTLGLLGMAAVSVCLAGSHSAAASDSGFTVRTRVAHAPARIDWSIANPGEWDVTVGYDAVRCEIYCSYRLKRDEFGRPRITGLLVPPVAAIRFYMDSEAGPEDIVIDPGGLEQPGIVKFAAPPVESVYLPGRRLAGSGPPETYGVLAAIVRSLGPVLDPPPAAVAVPANLPLRI